MTPPPPTEPLCHSTEMKIHWWVSTFNWWVSTLAILTKSECHLKNLLHWGGCHQLTKPVHIISYSLHNSITILFSTMSARSTVAPWSTVDHHNHHPCGNHPCWHAPCLWPALQERSHRSEPLPPNIQDDTPTCASSSTSPPPSTPLASSSSSSSLSLSSSSA